jgi:2-oxoglutarate/2-oxoacid ferredoxin oxidoreductase subunit alpha
MKNLITGNEAITKGLIKSGLKFFSAYPITPSSQILHSLIKSKVTHIIAEDEIAAINMVIGASLAGSKAATATSGPGFSLKQESIGYAFKTNTPLVIVNAQRVGPSTGMPTYSSQGDILAVKHGSHGDYVNIVFYPNSVEECYRYSIEAMNAAEESLSPVILLTDGMLSMMTESVDLKGIKVEIKKRDFKPLGKEKRKISGLLTKDNLPCTTEPKVYQEWYAERKAQILNTSKKYEFYEYSGNKKSDTLLIAYGTTSRVISELKNEYAIFRPIRLFPIISKLKTIAESYKKIVVIEMNDSQYQGELQSFLHRELQSITQLGGELSLNKIKNELKRLC